MKNFEIAKLLNVSPATVSLALNNKPGVSPDTRNKILELKNMALQENLEQVARQYEKGTIGVLVFRNRSDVIDETPFFTQLINTIDADVKKSSYKMNVVFPRADAIEEYIAELDALSLSGFIIIATEMTPETATRFKNRMRAPFIMVDAYFADDGIDCVLMDNRGGITQAMQYAYDLGFDRIGFVKSADPCGNFTERYLCYVNWLAAMGIQPDPDMVFSVRSFTEGAKTDFARILENKAKLPQILIAANDRIAIGVMSALREKGVRMPEDVSIIGFDDMPAAQYVSPALTSIKINAELIAHRAAERIVAKIENEGEREYALKQFVGVELIERDSVKMAQTSMAALA